MPEHVRALIVVALLSGLSWLAIRPSMAQTSSSSMTRRWRNLWLMLTGVAFLAGNFWLYAVFACLVLLAQRFSPVQALAAFCLLLAVVPAASIDVPGFGLINYFFMLDQPRLLSLVLLLPAALALSRRADTLRLGSRLADKLLLIFVLLTAALQLRESNLTSTLRGCFYLLTDIFLPYYVASRAVRHTEDFRQVFTAFTAACAVLGLLAVFETVRHWNLYAAVTSALGLHWGYGGYLGRDSLLRASASLGAPIVLGYVMSIGLGFWLYLQQGRRYSVRVMAPALLMAGGLLAALSRGPWVGMAATLMVFIWTGRRGGRNTALLVAATITALGVLSVFGFGQKVLNLLPFIGDVDDFNITYRQRLIDSAIAVVQRHFWLGSVGFLNTPEMQSMIQGQGIIDVVNTFVSLALNYGVVGLALFSSFFAVVLWQLWRTQRRLPMADEGRVLGRSLLATLAGIMVTIATVSSILVIPYLYWMVGGLSVAWLEMVRRNKPMRQPPSSNNGALGA